MPPSLTPRNDKPLTSLTINGSFDFWQRNSTFTSVAHAAYTADRFLNAKAAGSWSVLPITDINRVTEVPTVAQSGFQSNYSLKQTVTTAGTPGSTDSWRLIHRIEGYDYAAIHGQSVRLQFWVRSAQTGLYSVTFSNSAQTRIYTTSYTVNAANTWEKKTIDLTMDTAGTWLFDNNVGLILQWVLSAGSGLVNTTPNTWKTTTSGSDYSASASQVNVASSTSNSWQITQISLIPGDFSNQGTSVDIPFLRAGGTFSNELRLCQRYYEKSYDVGVAPGTAGSSFAAIFLMQAQAALSAGYALPWVFFKTQKRTTAPTVTLYGTGGNINNITLSGTGDVAGAVGEANQNGFYATRTATSLINAGLYTHFTASDEL